jgi:hypothetical protein
VLRLIQTVEFDFFSQVVHGKTDIEALQTWEDEGGASTHANKETSLLCS